MKFNVYTLTINNTFIRKSDRLKYILERIDDIMFKPGDIIEIQVVEETIEDEP